MNEHPLVSIVVITYNSGNTILETLDSIYNQTYSNIELIICDDFSRDNTIDLCEKWIGENGKKFTDVSLLQNRKNTGTVKNLNNGIKASNGKYVKPFAGDDQLVSSAIEEFVHFMQIHKDCRMCMSAMQLFSDDSEELLKKRETLWDSFFKNCKENEDRQKDTIIYYCLFTGPAFFYQKELIEEIGGLDESYVLTEEWPLCLKVINKGYRIFTIDKKLVKYRVSTLSVCGSYNNGLRRYQLYVDEYNLFKNQRRKMMLERHDYLHAWNTLMQFRIEGELQRRSDTYLSKVKVALFKILTPSIIKKNIKNLFK